MDCPRCGTPNMPIAAFCRRCGQGLSAEPVTIILGAMNGAKRPVRSADLREGRIVVDDPPGPDFLHRGLTYIGDVTDAFLEAARHEHAASTIRLVTGGWEEYDFVIETDRVVVRLHVVWPYARIECRGPRDAIRLLVRRVVARFGEDMFTARDSNWDRFQRHTGMSEAENKTALLDLLS